MTDGARARIACIIVASSTQIDAGVIAVEIASGSIPELGDTSRTRGGLAFANPRRQNPHATISPKTIAKIDVQNRGRDKSPPKYKPVTPNVKDENNMSSAVP